MVPPRLVRGNGMRVIAPARSLALISKDSQIIANKRITDLGLTLTFGTHVSECDAFMSSSIASRIEDLHAAFSDTAVQFVSTVIGGFNSNQLLPYIDFDLIKSNPKIFCGYSDITALSNAIYARTGLVTYSGPHYANFGEQLYFNYSLEHLKKCFFSDAPYAMMPSGQWFNDEWWLRQDDRHPIKNDGLIVIQEGEASGTIIGGNLRTFHYLAGTAYRPSLENSILFLEEDLCEDVMHFDSHLTAISQLPDFDGVRGVVIGRFQPESRVTVAMLKMVIANNKRLRGLPVLYGADFGHTTPQIAFPIGGTASITTASSPSILITTH